ncbi:MAG: PAS domain-containing protein, partial [Flavisolibacter sp.]
METTSKTRPSLHRLLHLPAFAQYLLEHKLDELARIQLQISREVDIPLLKLFGNLPPEQLLEVSRQRLAELLTFLAQNRAGEQIALAVQNWKKNRLPFVQKDDIVAEDITLITYLRKKSFLYFLPDYCPETGQMIEIIKEIDLFLLEGETAATNLYIQLLKERIDEHSHFIEKITNTSPGIIYVYDVIHNKELYANKTSAEFLGYQPEEIMSMGEKFVETLIHPDDIPALRAYEADFLNTRDGEIRSLKYRIRNNREEYRWLRTYETVFKRTPEGAVSQKIGIAIDVHEQKITAEQLQQREAELLEAQEIAQLGSFTWFLDGHSNQVSPQTKKILEADMVSREDFLGRVHPGDREKVERALEAALQTGKFETECRYRGEKDEKILWTRGRVNFREGRPFALHGTVMDITEKQRLLEQLQENSSLYQQAQALTHIGNFIWDLDSQQIVWSDEMYRIYDLEPSPGKLTFAAIESFVHPEDRLTVQQTLEGAIQHRKPFDFHFRIQTQKGREKILHAQGKVREEGGGKSLSLIGTTQDVTEKQQLIEDLRKSETLYKQAQHLAGLGNWALDLRTGDYTWSDEMFRIFELSPDIKMSFSQWEQYVHPEDRAQVVANHQASLKNHQPYEQIYRIIMPDGRLKILHRKAGFEFDRNGEAIHMIGTTQDVTVQQKVQQELRENQTFIRKITDATPSIITSYNVNTGKYVFISEGLEKLLGYTIAEGMEKGLAFFMSLVHPEDLPELREKQERYLKEANAFPDKRDPVVEHTYRLQHKHGHYCWIHTYSTIFDRNHEGRVEHVLNISLDVTEQREATLKIAEQEHFIQQIADASPTILYLYEVDSQRIVYINREIFFVLGHLPDEVLEMGAAFTEQLYHPDDLHLLPARKQSQKNFQQVDSMIQYECRLKSKEGDWRWFLVREIVFKTDEKGQVKQVLGAALDINRRKEMEKTILQNALLLEQSNASLEEFAYVASHDLKEPLRKISTFGDRLTASQMDKLSPEGRTYLTKIVEASQRMQTMINDLLSISMISGNHSFEKCSLQEILEETLQTLEFKIEQLNARIEADPLPEAHIIPSQFRQLFQNLLSNSLKFVRENTQPIITIRYALVSSQEVVHYQLAQADHYHKIEFSDNGIGFEN